MRAKVIKALACLALAGASLFGAYSAGQKAPAAPPHDCTAITYGCKECGDVFTSSVAAIVSQLARGKK